MAEMKITGQNFQKEVLESGQPVLLDFWAPWCGPCRRLSPIVEKLAEEYKGIVKVKKVNVDEEAELAAATLKTMGYTKVMDIGGISGYRGKIVR